MRRYCLGLAETPLIQAELVRDTRDEIEFRNGG
jgi:hypothetical protein